jgi:hypothetical protein
LENHKNMEKSNHRRRVGSDVDEIRDFIPWLWRSGKVGRIRAVGAEIQTRVTKHITSIES